VADAFAMALEYAMDDAPETTPADREAMTSEKSVALRLSQRRFLDHATSLAGVKFADDADAEQDVAADHAPARLLVDGEGAREDHMPLPRHRTTIFRLDAAWSTRFPSTRRPSAVMKPRGAKPRWGLGRE
jgi:hypothetical protein